MRPPSLGKLPLGHAHRWFRAGSSDAIFRSLCGLHRVKGEVDFKAEFMWPECGKCRRIRATVMHAPKMTIEEPK